MVIKNDQISINDIETLNPKAFVFSPGPGVPSGLMLDILEQFYTKIPILGICLGHQAIGLFFKSKLIKAPYPMHGKVSKIKANISHAMFFDLPESFNICRYHSLVLSNIDNQEIKIIAKSIDDDQIMAIAHQKWPIWGIQFHPEAILTENGISILKNWIYAFNLQKN